MGKSSLDALTDSVFNLLMKTESADPKIATPIKKNIITPIGEEEIDPHQLPASTVLAYMMGAENLEDLHLKIAHS